VLETRYVALSTETTMLEQELSTLPLRTQLLEAKFDQEKANVDAIGERMQVLDELIDRKRRQAAEQATTAAEQTQRELEGMHPVLVELSAENAALSRDVNDITQQLQAQDLVRQNLEQVVEQLDADYQDARETLESGEVNDDLGRILLQQFDALPDLRAFVQNDEQRKRRSPTSPCAA
jgi:potassium efflux system protein